MNAAPSLHAAVGKKLRKFTSVMAAALDGFKLPQLRTHRTLDVVFNDDQSGLRKGHGALNMAIVRYFALDLQGR